MLQALADALDYAVASLWVPTGDGSHLRCDTFTVTAGILTPRFEAATRGTLLPRGVGVVGHTWELQAPQWIGDLAANAAYLRNEPAQAEGLRSLLAFPLVARGRFVGVVELAATTTRVPTDELVDALDPVGGLLGDFFERTWLERDRQVLLDELERERNRLRAVLEQLPSGVLIADLTPDAPAPDAAAPGAATPDAAAADAALGIPGSLLPQVTITGNEAATRILGPPEPIPGSGGRGPGAGSGPGDGAALVHPHRRPDGTLYAPHELPLLRALGGEPVDVELEIRRGDGSPGVVSVSAAPVRDSRGRVVSAVAIYRDITERQRAARRLEVLAQASVLLTTALDADATLQALPDLVVPRLADACVVDVLEDGVIRRAGAAFADPAKAAIAADIDHVVHPTQLHDTGLMVALRTGEPQLYADVADDALAGAAVNDEHLRLLRELEARSAMIVPLVARGEVLGAITLSTFGAGHRFGPADLDAAAELGHRAAVALSHARLFEREQAITASLQDSLLPPRLPDIPGLELAARYRSGSEEVLVGGDFYDAFPIDDHRWGLLIGDVCGRGAGAAAMTAAVRHTARALVGSGMSPATAMHRINSALLTGERSSQFCTLVLVVVEPVAGTSAAGTSAAETSAGTTSVGARARVAVAGHPLPLLATPDGVVQAAGRRGSLLGIFPDPLIDEDAVTLPAGSTLVLFTDGVTEARAGNVQLGDDGLARILTATAAQPVESVAAAIEQGVLDHTGGAVRDDVAVLAVRVGGRQHLGSAPAASDAAASRSGTAGQDP